MHQARVDNVRVESDKVGYHLYVSTEDGDEFDFLLSEIMGIKLAFQETLPIRLLDQEGRLVGDPLFQDAKK